uniref:Uncharacterized protein n=1 Tax=Ciona savignyi TaxID=51511 RepID=H2Y4Z9_CIOSA
MPSDVALEVGGNSNEEIVNSHDPLVETTPHKDHKHHHHHHGKHKKKKHHVGGLIIQTLPPSPADCCDFLDPVCNNDLHLAIVTTLCCWLFLGVIPILFGFLSIHYAIKASKTKDEEVKARYSRISRNISWIGMLLITIVVTLAVVILATCGIL